MTINQATTGMEQKFLNFKYHYIGKIHQFDLAIKFKLYLFHGNIFYFCK